MTAPSVEVSYPTRPGTATSSRTKITRVEDEEKPTEKVESSDDAADAKLQVSKHPVLVGGEGESAIPEDKKVRRLYLIPLFHRALNSIVQEEPLENAEDDWTHDPQNPRNWSVGKKWVMVGVVRFFTLFYSARD